MAKITVEANQCDVCGHVWLPSGKPAVQCAKCRSRKWNNPPDILEQAIRRAPKGAVAVALTTASGEIIETRVIPERTVEYEE